MQVAAWRRNNESACGGARPGRVGGLAGQVAGGGVRSIVRTSGSSFVTAMADGSLKIVAVKQLGACCCLLLAAAAACCHCCGSCLLLLLAATAAAAAAAWEAAAFAAAPYSCRTNAFCPCAPPGQSQAASDRGRRRVRESELSARHHSVGWQAGHATQERPSPSAHRSRSSSSPTSPRARAT